MQKLTIGGACHGKCCYWVSSASFLSVPSALLCCYHAIISGADYASGSKWAKAFRTLFQKEAESLCAQTPYRDLGAAPGWAPNGQVQICVTAGKGHANIVLLNNSASPGVGGCGGPTPPPPDPDFIVGKNEILQKEIIIDLAVFGTQTFGLLGSRTPPPPQPPLRRTPHANFSWPLASLLFPVLMTAVH